MSVKELSEPQVDVMRDRIERSKDTLVDFRYYLLNNGKDNVAPAPFHYVWSDILLKSKGNFAIEGFRESAKGQIVLRAFPLSCLLFPTDANDYIVLIKETATLASQKLIEIEDEYMSNPILCANMVKVQQRSAKVFSVDVKDSKGEVVNVRIEAYGKGSAIRGLANVDRRPRIVILDDPQSLEDSRSETVLENDWNWFLSDVNFLGQTTKTVIIGNNLGDKCIVERVINDNLNLGYRSMRVAVLDKNGEPTWPEKFSREYVEKERLSYASLGKSDVWHRERMCQALTAENQVFRLTDFVRYSYLYLDKITQHCNFFVTIDPASSKEPGACYRAICVNAVTEDNRWIIVDFPYGRWGSDELIDKIFDVVLKWTPYNGRDKRLPVGIEKGHFKQILEPFIRREMQKRNVWFDIRPIEHAKEGNKLERVKMLAPRVASHTILLPENADWLAELETEIQGVTRDGFKSLFNDLIDCMSMQNQIALPPVTGRQERERKINEDVGGYDPLTEKYSGQVQEVGVHDPLRL